MAEPPIIPPENNPSSDPSWSSVPQGYPPPPAGYPPPGSYSSQQGQYQPPPPGYAAPPAADSGLSDTAAGALAYVTIIPAIIFLVMAPYNTKPFIKFHCFQCLGLAVTWFCVSIFAIIPILGWIVFLLGSIALLVSWVLCIVKASQGSAFKLPVIGNFAAQQSGYTI